MISAVDGIDGLTRMLWEECAAVQLPRAVVITKVDQQRGDFDDVVMTCQDVFGEGVAPLYFPAAGDDGLKGLIGLLSQRCLDYSTGKRAECDPDPQYLEQIAEQRASLIEGIIQESEDETLMDRYLSGEDIDVKALIEDLETAVARGSFYPVLATSVPHGDHPGPVVGMLELLEVITQAFPSPLEHGIPR